MLEVHASVRPLSAMLLTEICTNYNYSSLPIIQGPQVHNHTVYIPEFKESSNVDTVDIITGAANSNMFSSFVRFSYLFILL